MLLASVRHLVTTSLRFCTETAAWAVTRAVACLKPDPILCTHMQRQTYLFGVGRRPEGKSHMVDSLALQSVTLGASNIPDHDPSWVFCSTLVLQGLTGLGQDGGGHSSKTEVQARVCCVHYHISLHRCRGEGGGREDIAQMDTCLLITHQQ